MRKRIYSRYLQALLCLSIGFIQPTMATAADQNEKSSTMQEESKKKSGDSSQQIESIIVTATKTATPAELMPVTAYSVDVQDIEAQPDYYMNNFGELIRDLPGVHVAQYYPWGPPWVHLRGTGYFIGRTAFLVDGIPVSPFLSQTIANNNIKQVDVVLGPVSALYGPNAAGGAVNIITKSGEDLKGIDVGMGYGSFNTVRPHVSVGDKQGKWNYYFSYNGETSDGYKMKPVAGMVDLYKAGKTQYLWDASYEANEYRYNYYTGKVGWENDNGVGFVANYNFEDMYLYGGQPGLILNDDGTQSVGSFKFYTPLGDAVKLTATVGYQLLDRPGSNVKGLTLKGGKVVVDSTPTTRTEWQNDRIPMELQADIVPFKNNILTLGTFYLKEEELKETYTISSGVRTAKTDTNTDQIGLYLQDQHFFMDDKLSILGGLRWDTWKFYDIYDQSSTPQTPDDIEKDHVTYRGGARYRVNDILAIKSSFGTAYWPGTATWFFNNTKSGATWREANPDLEPEKTWMVDFGTELTFKKTGTQISLTPYWGKITDMVSYRYDVNPKVAGGTIIRTQNLGEAEIYGLEIGLSQFITKEIELFGSLTLNHSRLENSGINSGNQLRNAPDYHGSIGLRYLNPELVNAQTTLRFSDDRYYDDENTELPYFHMEAYETVDAKIWRDWKLTNGWTMTTALSATNILDEEYATEIVYVNPGFTAQADISFSYKF